MPLPQHGQKPWRIDLNAHITQKCACRHGINNEFTSLSKQISHILVLFSVFVFLPLFELSGPSIIMKIMFNY